MMLSEAASAANSLSNVSSAEINASQDLLKQAIGFYSANIKNYAKWFEISEVNKNEETFTSYKVVYRFLPKDLNESIKQVVVWKRFRDFKDLNQFMANHHAALHRRDKFPEFVKSKFFGRFDDKVIEERRQYSLRLLQFIGSQSHLYKTDKFIEFFCTEGAIFTDYQTSESMTGRVLQPTLSPEKLKRSETSSTTNNLTVLITDIGSFIDSHCSSSNPNSYDYVIDNLVKTRKLLTLSATAQNTSAKSSSTNLNNNNASSTSLSTATSAADKYLKSALSNLSDFMAEMDLNRASSGDVSSERKNFLKSVYRRINSLMDESLLARQKASTPLEVTGAGNGKAAATPTASPEANFLNDWILSDFNLVSNDFNNELSFISGNLFDLSFNYKLVRLINDKCFLMKLRHATSDSNGNNSDTNTNEYFFLKRLQKSFNPSLTSKSLVPFKNRIPFMCQLLKYYESESTIFLLIEYHKYGPVYPHLLRLIRHSIQSYPENLPELYNFLSTSSFAAHSTLHAVSIGGANKAAMSSSITNVIDSKQQQQQQQQQQPQRRIRFSRSFSGFSYSLRRSSSSSSLLLSNVPKSSHVPKETTATETSTTTDKRRAQSHSHSVKLTVLTTPVEIQPEVDKTIFSSSSMSPPSELAASMSLSSSSSSSGLDATDNNASTTPRDRDESSKIEFSSGGGGSSRVVFKATTTATNSNSTLSPSCTTDEDKKSPSWSSKKQQKSTNEMNQPVSKYQKQVKLWLAQVLCALRNLHEMGIVCKDLTSDDLVLSQSGDVLLSYVSKWNLVEESIKKRAIDELYSAPELSGMVNNPVGESCDWWSFGVIAYELITTQKFANFHERHEIYVDKINFPSDFKCDLGKDLIRKLLRLNPAKRLTREQIQQHPYFSETDWISLEESFWKSK